MPRAVTRQMLLAGSLRAAYMRPLRSVGGTVFADKRGGVKTPPYRYIILSFFRKGGITARLFPADIAKSSLKNAW